MKKRFRQFLWDFWSDHMTVMYVTAWVIVMAFIFYGMWLCAR